MSQVTLLIDNDVVIKLAQMDAYADAITSIPAPANKVGSLGVMLRYMRRLSEGQRLTRDEADRLQDVILNIVEIEPTSDESKLSAILMKVILEDELDMDEGEVALVAVGIKRASTDIATGDKRALLALPALERRFPELKQLRGRFVCFEQIVKRLCEVRGLARVRTAVITARHADGAITKTYDYFESRGARALARGLEIVIRETISTPAPGWLKNL